MDVLFELLGELIGGLYFGLAEIIVPEKNFSKAQKTALQTICMIVMLGAVALLWAGIIFITDGLGFTAGVIMTAAGGFIIALHIVLGVIVTVREVKKNKKNGKKQKR